MDHQEASDVETGQNTQLSEVETGEVIFFAGLDIYKTRHILPSDWSVPPERGLGRP